MRIDNKGKIELTTPERADQAMRIELRGASGRLYGILDRSTMQIEFKLKRDEPAERIDLRPYLEPGI